MFTLTGTHCSAQQVSKQQGPNFATLPLQPHGEGVSLGDRTLAPPPGWQEGRALRILYLGPLAQLRSLQEPTPRECHSSHAGPGRLWRTVLSAPGQASRGHRSLFTPLEVRFPRGRLWGEQAGASPLRFKQFRSLNNRTAETHHDWSVWV